MFRYFFSCVPLRFEFWFQSFFGYDNFLSHLPSLSLRQLKIMSRYYNLVMKLQNKFLELGKYVDIFWSFKIDKNIYASS